LWGSWLVAVMLKAMLVEVVDVAGFPPVQTLSRTSSLSPPSTQQLNQHGGAHINESGGIAWLGVGRVMYGRCYFTTFSLPSPPLLSPLPPSQPQLTAHPITKVS